MVAVVVQLAIMVTYVVVARVTRRHPPAFALVNVSTAVLLFVVFAEPAVPLLFFAGYVAIVAGQYLCMRAYAEREGASCLIAFLSPIATLAAVKLVPVHVIGRPLAWYFVGISYLAFRLSHLVLEVRNKVVSPPTLSQYLSFAFFLPTLVVGPISPYSTYERSLGGEGDYAAPVPRALFRLLVGGCKFLFLSNVWLNLAYSRLLLDGATHPLWHLPIAAIAYVMYLYCNFSGFCDIAVGAAALIGIEIRENFRSPFAARSVKDFWNRWHITLSEYTRDMIFYPLSKVLVGWQPRLANHMIAVTIACVFVAIGLWHGFAWNYVCFGALHAVGVITNHYYAILLKRRLNRDAFRAYNGNRWVARAATAATFAYVSATFLFFANDFDGVRKIVGALR